MTNLCQDCFAKAKVLFCLMNFWKQAFKIHPIKSNIIINNKSLFRLFRVFRCLISYYALGFNLCIVEVHEQS